MEKPVARPGSASAPPGEYNGKIVSAGGTPNPGIPFSSQRAFQTRMAVGIVQRIAFRLSVISRVVHQYIFTFRRLRKAVVSRPILAIFIALVVRPGAVIYASWRIARGSSFTLITVIPYSSFHRWRWPNS